MAIDFKGKVAIVTGAGLGLGKAYALELAKRGAKVVVNDLGGALDGTGGSSEAAQKTVEEIKAAGGEAVANGASVADEAGAKSIVKDAVDAFGTVDIVINNAGILRDKSFKKVTMGDFHAVVDVHLFGSVLVTKEAWPVMNDKGYGRIVMTTSSSGLYGNFGQTNYGAAKLGLIGFMNCLKHEGAKKNIHVNAIAPTSASRMTAPLMPPDVLEKLKPEAVVPAVLYMCSDEAPTGMILESGGGYVAAVQIMESKGVKIGPDHTVEDVAANIEKIKDMKEATPFNAGPDVVMKILS
jgi:NAD(P)-dependent dehydrogenase (short-subunit alcohol dehydrogenase family)